MVYVQWRIRNSKKEKFSLLRGLDWESKNHVLYNLIPLLHSLGDIYQYRNNVSHQSKAQRLETAATRQLSSVIKKMGGKGRDSNKTSGLNRSFSLRRGAEEDFTTWLVFPLNKTTVGSQRLDCGRHRLKKRQRRGHLGRGHTLRTSNPTKQPWYARIQLSCLCSTQHTDSAPLDHHLSFLLTGSPVRGCDSLRKLLWNSLMRLVIFQCQTCAGDSLFAFSVSQKQPLLFLNQFATRWRQQRNRSTEISLQWKLCEWSSGWYVFKGDFLDSGGQQGGSQEVSIIDQT